MGSLSDTPLSSLVRYVANDRKVRIFVETGTAHGTSAFFASGFFDRVITIDIREDFQDEARRRQADWQAKGLPLDNIEYVVGDTRDVFEPIVKSLTGPAFFWLDAHSFPGPYGPTYDCPLLTELGIINKYDRFGHYIVIDDVHDLDPPMDASTYPTIRQVLETGAMKTIFRLSMIAHDTVVFMPGACGEDVLALEGFRDAAG
jgi:hypothetical protein